MKHNSEAMPDKGHPSFHAPSQIECYLSNNRDLWLLHYQREREIDKFLEFTNWCLREGKKVRGLPMPEGWEV